MSFIVKKIPVKFQYTLRIILCLVVVVLFPIFIGNISINFLDQGSVVPDVFSRRLSFLVLFFLILNPILSSYFVYTIIKPTIKKLQSKFRKIIVTITCLIILFWSIFIFSVVMIGLFVFGSRFTIDQRTISGSEYILLEQPLFDGKVAAELYKSDDGISMQEIDQKVYQDWSNDPVSGEYVIDFHTEFGVYHYRPATKEVWIEYSQ